jgi:replicative DNA helicase
MFEAARGVLGCWMLDWARTGMLLKRNGVGPAWFADKCHREIFLALSALAERTGGAVDLMLAVEQLRSMDKLEDVGGVEALTRIVDETPTAAHAEYYLDVLRGTWMGRAAEAAITEFRKYGEHGGEVALNELVQRLQGVVCNTSQQLEMDKRKIAEEIEAEWKMAHSMRIEHHDMNWVPGLPLPWMPLTKIMGGLQPGLHILAARPSAGKTSMAATNYSEYWCEKKIPHLFISLDMQAKDVEKRNTSARTCAREHETRKGESLAVSMARLQFGTARHEQFAAALEELRVVSENCCHIVEDCYHIDRIESAIAMAIQKWGIKAVILDYLQVVEVPNQDRMNENQRMSRVSSRLKKIYKQYKIPILALSQLSRDIEKEKRPPQLSDLRDSGAIEQDAMSVGVLWVDPEVQEKWQAYPPVGLAYGDEHLAATLRPVWLCVLKNQNGPTRWFPTIFYPSYFLFRPGNYEAQREVEREERGGRKIYTNAGFFAQVRDDWRFLPTDGKLADARVLGSREAGMGEM